MCSCPPLLHARTPQNPHEERHQKKIAAQAASMAGEAKGKNKMFTEEEAYKVSGLR